MKETIEIGDRVFIEWEVITQQGTIIEVIVYSDKFKTYKVKDEMNVLFKVAEERVKLQSFIKIFDIEL